MQKILCFFEQTGRPSVLNVPARLLGLLLYPVGFKELPETVVVSVEDVDVYFSVDALHSPVGA